MEVRNVFLKDLYNNFFYETHSKGSLTFQILRSLINIFQITIGSLFIHYGILAYISIIWGAVGLLNFLMCIHFTKKSYRLSYIFLLFLLNSINGFFLADQSFYNDNSLPFIILYVNMMIQTIFTFSIYLFILLYYLCQ